MSQKDKLIKRLLLRPKDFTWDELLKLLNSLGYTLIKGGKTGGSRRRFEHLDYGYITLHEPHPTKVLKRYQIDQLIDHLKEEKLL